MLGFNLLPKVRPMRWGWAGHKRAITEGTTIRGGTSDVITLGSSLASTAMGDKMQVYSLEVSLHGEFLRQLKCQTPVGRLQEGTGCPFTLGEVGVQLVEQEGLSKLPGLERVLNNNL